MSSQDPKGMLWWIDAWKKAEPTLQRLRNEQIRKTDTKTALLHLADAFEAARIHFTPQPCSGLVLQQALFKRLHTLKQ